MLTSSAAVLLLSRVAGAAPPPVVPVEPSATCCFEGPTGTCSDQSRFAVCLLDPYCCNTAWDSQCIAEFEETNDWSCPPLFEGDYAPSGAAEVSAFNDLVCEDTSEWCQWHLEFQLPAGRTRGSRGTTAVDGGMWCPIDEDGGGTAGWPAVASAPIEIVYATGGVLRGIVRMPWESEFEHACVEETSSILFEVRPPATNGCSTASSQPGCNNVWTEACVCYQDPFCCETAWDQHCANERFESPCV